MTKSGHNLPNKGERATDNTFSARVSFRFSKNEYDTLVELAEKHGTTISGIIRIILFGNNEENQNIKGIKSQKNHKEKIENTLVATRAEFRKLTQDYREISEGVKRALDSGAAGADVVVRSFRALEDITLDMQKTLNAVLHELGSKEVHQVSRMAKTKAETGPPSVRRVPISVSKDDYERFILLFCYMEKIQIIGNLAEDATEYIRDGVERMRFKVIVERRYEKEKEKVSYTVFSPKEPIFEYLKKGSWVFVMGTFSEDRKSREKVIFPDVIRLGGNK